MTENVKLGFGLLFCFATALGAIYDITSYRIPNFVTYGLALAFVPYAYVTWPTLPFTAVLINAAAVFACCVVFWQLKWLGAGDVKFLTAVSLWMPPDLILIFVFLVSIFAMGFIGLLRALRRWNPWVKSKPFPAFIKQLIDTSDRAIPYGLPIAMAALSVTVPQLLS